MPPAFTLRTAQPEDTPALSQLIQDSVRSLQPQYTTEEREEALRGVFTVDRSLIADSTYFLAEHEGRLAGCGGWSRRHTLFGGDQYQLRQDTLLDPTLHAAKIRAFFIHPDFARQGLATLILNACEAAARAAGFTSFELAATLSGIPFYRARGFVETAPIDVRLPNGRNLPVMKMTRSA